MNFLGYLYFWVVFSNMTHENVWFDFLYVMVVLLKGNLNLKTNKLIHANSSYQV